MSHRVVRRLKRVAMATSSLLLASLVIQVSHIVADLGASSASHASAGTNGASSSKTLGLRGGENLANPNGIWDSFRKVGTEAEDDGLPDLRERNPCVWGKASANRRTQEEVQLRVVCEDTAPGEDLYAVGDREGDPNHKIKIQMTTENNSYPVWTSKTKLDPGKYRFKFAIESGLPEERVFREYEELQGMWGVEEYREITVLPTPPPDAVLLMSDIDGTLVGDEGATSRFRETWNREYRPKGCKLIYNTGRPFNSALRLLTEGKLDVPDALVCSEGTEVYWFHSGRAEEGEPDYEWRERLMSSWDYPHLRQLIEGVLHERQQQYSDAFFLPEMSGQPMIVVKVPGQHEAGELSRAIHHQIQEAHGIKFDLTVSGGGGNWFLLIVPPGAGKGSAALHCSKRTGFDPQRVMVAGDGENDVPLFEYTRKGFKGTMVGNVCNGLAEWATQKKRPTVYRSPSCHALGVLEGLQHHFEPTAALPPGAK